MTQPLTIHAARKEEVAMADFAPIGIIRSPFRDAPGTPIQPVFAEGTEGTVEVFPQYADGLRDLEGFERVWLIYWFHKAPSGPLRVTPFRDTAEHGIFATRAPCRPNAIGLSCVRLLSVAGNVLTIGGVDILDGTPLLDIKPYVPAFDSFSDAKAGWLDAQRVDRTHADERFKPGETR
jgi:tRNA-Thr(GGU) m(6)t(6)A37 methyltransferase TsaA